MRGAIRSVKYFDYAGARGDLERALALNPSDARSMRWMVSMVLLPVGEVNGAIAMARRATELDPLDSELWSVLGEALVQAGQMEEARKALDRALEISPESEVRGVLALTGGRSLRATARRPRDVSAAAAAVDEIAKVHALWRSRGRAGMAGQGV